VSKKAIVTGGSRGIGAAIVKTLVREDFQVAFSYISNKEKADALVEEIEREGGKEAHSGRRFEFRLGGSIL
jgi:3-oxoacyl-[acyl-carrier protein] reductase